MVWASLWGTFTWAAEATEVSSALRVSAGWRDNVMLSPFAPVSRALARAEVETMAVRGWGTGFTLVGFVNGDVIRYVSPPPETAGEQQWYAQGELRWMPVSSVRLALKTAAFYQDAVIDLSEAQNVRLVAPTHATGGNATASVRWQLPAGFALESSFQGRRTTYRDYAGDYDEARPTLRLEWKPNPTWEVALSAFRVDRPYASRPQYTAGGRALAGTQLRLEQVVEEVRVRRRGELAGGRWNVGVTTGWLTNRDHASGYFDYDQRRGRLTADLERGGWLVAGEVEARRTAYRIQTVGAGLAPPPRIADGYEGTLRLTRLLGPRRQVFAEYRWERNRSNEEQFAYRANTMLAGWQLSF